MAVASAEELRGVLFKAYDSFADKRLKDLGRDAPFIVDDRSQREEDAQGHLFLWFCQILASAEGADQVRLTFRGGVPEAPAVAEWFDAHGGQHTNVGLEVTLTPANLGDLHALAKAFSAITRGRYEVKAYKYVVPRTVKSLRRLHDVLAGAWS